MGPWDSAEPLRWTHPIRDFTCGDRLVDDWIHSYALRRQRQGRAQVTVCTHSSDTAVRALFAVTSRHLQVAGADATAVLPATPEVVIERLALRGDLRGRGHGVALLFEALASGVDVVHGAADAVVTLEASTPERAAWYRANGFTPFSSDALRLWMPLTTAAATVDAARSEGLLLSCSGTAVQEGTTRG